MAKSDNQKKSPEKKSGLEERLRRLKEETSGLGEIEDKKKKAKQETSRQTPDIKREVLEEEVIGPDKETSETIMGIEELKERQEKMRALERLNLVGMTLFAKFRMAGIGKSEIETLPKLKQTLKKVETDPQYAKLRQKFNSAEKAALRKYQDILSKPPDSDDYQDLKAEWSIFMMETERHINDAQIGAKEVKDELAGKKEKAKTTLSKALNYIKKHPVGIICAIAAGIGLYVLLKSTKKSDGKSWTERLFNKKTGIGAGAIGALILGAIAGDDILKWGKEKLVGKGKEQLEKAQKLLKQGKTGEALAALLEGSEKNSENYKKIAEAVGKDMKKEVDPKAIQRIANARYDQFMSAEGRGKSFALEQAKKLSGLSAAAVKRLTGGADQGKQEKIIREYLEKHHQKIKALNLPQTASLLDVLAALTGTKVEKEEAHPSAVVEDPNGNVVTVEQKLLDDLKNQFEKAPNFQNFLKKYEKMGWSNAVWHPFTFSEDLYKACKADGLPVLVDTTGILLWNGYKWVTFTSAKSIAGAFIDFVKAPFDDDKTVLDAVGKYLEGSAPFIGLFGVSSAMWAKIRGGNPFKAGAEGAARGFIFPVEVADLHYRAGRRVYYWGREAHHFTDISRLDGPEKVEAFRRRMKWHADVAAKYDDWYRASERGAQFGPKKVWGVLRRESIATLREEFLKKFIDSYNDLQKAMGGKAVPLNMGDDVAKAKAREKMLAEAGKQPSKGPSGKPGTPMDLDSKPEKMGEPRGGGLDAEHQYKYNGEKITFTEKELRAKAAEIAKERKAAGDTARKGAKTAWAEENVERATKALCEERFMTPTAVKGKPNIYRFAGQDFKITPEQIKAAGGSKADALRKLAMDESLRSVTVQDFRTVKGPGGKISYEYKIGGKWESSDTPRKLGEMEEAFREAARREGKAIDFKRFAKEAKTIKMWPALAKLVGPAFAAYSIYQMETAKDKRLAVSREAAGWALAIGGAKFADQLIGNRIPPTSPGKAVARGLIMLAGGFAAALGLTEPISAVLNYGFAKIPGSHAVSEEAISLFEKGTARQTTRMVLQSAERGILKRFVEKRGWQTIEKIFSKRIQGTFMKKIGELAAKRGFRAVLKRLGWRGITTAALLADNATVIGVVDDFVAAGFMIWMGKDLIDMVKLIANASEIQSEMEKRSGHTMTSFEIVDEASRSKVEALLQTKGLALENIQNVDEDTLFAILKQLSEAKIRIRREGMPGYETWTLVNGEATGIRISDDAGRTKAAISEADAGELGKQLARTDKQEPVPPPEQKAA